MNNESNVKIVRVSDKEDAVVIAMPPRPLCRTCKEPLCGGEVDYGTCDLCETC